MVAAYKRNAMTTLWSAAPQMKFRRCVASRLFGPSFRSEAWARSFIAFVVLLIASARVQAVGPPAHAPALSPQDSLKQIVVDPGLQAELVACEPNVIDPVAIRFDEDGRLWVVEMREYPTGATKEFPATSRISVLRDRDGDGFYETATVFADDLTFATGVQPWKDGVFVTMAGQVAYMKDTNGDGKADLRETWYTGFAQSNEQLRANHPTFSLDGYIYVANGLRGGAIVDARKPGTRPVSISGMDFRFNPITGEFGAASGVGQFGLTIDDCGNRFVCTNRNPVIHVVLEDYFLKRNPLAAVPAVATDVAKAAADSRVFPIGRSWTTSNLHAGQFTAACGICVYRGDALPPNYYGNVLTCEPTGHLVHREIMKPLGVTFTSTPAREGVEFFASRDEWCCPVNLEVGPDGAIYVVDMYRQIIEHPEWMPEELRNRPNLRAGNDRGRIYRVVSKGFHRPSAQALSKASSASLVEKLENTSAWWRETAARLLLERGDKSVSDVLRQVALKGRSIAPRIAAMRVLADLNLVDDEILAKQLQDANPRIIEQAIYLSEPRLPHAKQLQERIAALASHEDARVRLATLLAAVALPPAPKFAADIWEQDAMLIASGDQGGTALGTMLADGAALKTHIADCSAFVRRLAKLAAASKVPEQRTIAIQELLKSEQFGMPGLTGFLEEVIRQGTTLSQLKERLDVATRTRIDELMANAKSAALATDQAEGVRCESIDLLAYVTDAVEHLRSLAASDANQNVQLHAIAALAKGNELDPWKQLLAGSATSTPAVQRAIVDSVFLSVERTSLMLDMIERGELKPTVIDLIHSKMLLAHGNVAIRRRAEKLLAAAIPADREKALATYRPALDLEANARHGKDVFEKRCSICHKIGDVGVQVAPDISDSREKTPIQILTDVLQPNRAVDSNYFSFTATTTDGRVHTGILAAESSTSITLKQQEGKSENLLRSEIEELRCDGISLMPEGLEKDTPPQDMADLISFIKNWRYIEHSSHAPAAGL